MDLHRTRMTAMNTSPPKDLPALPASARSAGDGLPAHLENLAETARNYARGAKAKATQRAYHSDWRQFTAWCRHRGLDDPDSGGPSGPLPPDPK
jgi:hypothetical protein